VFSVKIGARIRRLREARQLSQSALARRAKIGRVALNRIEQGAAVPSLRTLTRIATALRVKVRALFPA
jgi:transcriptional regulator with XRE-family HTH domain